MPKFRQRPTVIEAVQLMAVNHDKITIAERKPPDWFVKAYAEGEIEASLTETLRGAWITTPHGPVLARPGDWIIRNPDGGIYPVDPEAFDKTYEAIK